MGHQYVQLPPDSRGKKVFHGVHVEINYENGTVDFVVGDTITGASSGVYGTVTLIIGTTVAGILHVSLDSLSDTAFQGSENLQVAGITNATFVDGSQNSYYIPGANIVDGKNPANAAAVDPQGSLQVGFGEHELDAYGRLDTADSTTIAEYKFDTGKHPYTISEETSGAATATYNASGSYVDMECTNAAGDAVIMTTNIYHQSMAGQSQRCLISSWHGDTGKTNNIRRWGYFDEKDGAFFELNGTTFNCVVRSTATDAFVENRTPQTEFTDDHLDGDNDAENLSGLTFNITKIQGYWIDFAWPAGGVRFGIIYDHKKILIHQARLSNTHAYPTTGHIRLPLRWENKNTDATAGNSNMYIMSSNVVTEGRFEPELNVHAFGSDLVTINTSASLVPVFSGRMIQRKDSGGILQDVRYMTRPNSISVYNNSSIPLIIELQFSPVLAGATWAESQALSFTLIDNTATAITIPGALLSNFFAKPNDVTIFDFDFDLNTVSGKLFNLADVSNTPYHMTIAAKLMDNQAGTAEMKALMNWVEY